MAFSTKRAFSLALLTFALCSCDKDRTIESYSAPKESTPSGVAAAPAQAASQGQFPRDLRWTLPAGWSVAMTAEAPSAVFAADAHIQVRADLPGWTLSVSHLGDNPEARSVSANVNRWAGQLGLPNLSEADLAKAVTQLQVGDVLIQGVDLKNSGNRLLGAIIPHASETWFIKLMGPESAVAGQQGKFDEFLRSIRFESATANVTAANPAQDPAAQPTSPAASSSLATGAGGATWTLPQGWSAEPGDGFRLALLHTGGNDAPQVKVSKLANVGGGAGANVSRWRNEVGLAPVDDANADPGKQQKLGEQNWTVHDYTGPLDGGKRVVVALTEANGATWFFKLSGAPDAVENVMPQFNGFLAGIRFMN